MAVIDGAADLDYSLTANAGLAAVLSTRAIGAAALAGDDDEPAPGRRTRMTASRICWTGSISA